MPAKCVANTGWNKSSGERCPFPGLPSSECWILTQGAGESQTQTVRTCTHSSTWTRLLLWTACHKLNYFGSIYLGFKKDQLHASIFAFQVVLVVKKLSANAGDIRNTGSIPGWGRSPRKGNGSPLQYSCLENPVDRRARWATVHGVAKSQTGLERLNIGASMWV